MAERTLEDALADARRVVVLGDVHGETTWLRTVIARASDLEGLDVILQVGDFGIGPWPGDTRDKVSWTVGRELAKHSMWMLVTPGNHENHHTLARARRDAAGRIVLGREGRLLAYERGHRETIGGRAFGSLGGAISVDRYAEAARAGSRMAGRSWWPEEEVTQADVDALGDDDLDVLVTHDVPARVPMVGWMRIDPHTLLRAHGVRELLDQAIDRTQPSVVLSGHWHQRVTHDLVRADGGTTRCEVISDEFTIGSAIVLDLTDLSVAPLQEVWSREVQ